MRAPSSRPVRVMCVDDHHLLCFDAELAEAVKRSGAGLIGTSVGLALTRAGVQVTLSDLDPETARRAAELGAGTAGLPPDKVEVFVAAAPPAAVAQVLDAAITAPHRGSIDCSPVTFAPVPLNTGKARTPSPKWVSKTSCRRAV